MPAEGRGPPSKHAHSSSQQNYWNRVTYAVVVVDIRGKLIAMVITDFAHQVEEMAIVLAVKGSEDGTNIYSDSRTAEEKSGSPKVRKIYVHWFLAHMGYVLDSPNWNLNERTHTLRGWTAPSTRHCMG
ncbi:hypothetical protein HPB50_003980 [Hyalomma asiaticum]|uniref:Uncharacterized protein n=1 Tax=Hyalomma asiaticum TaxID=266040 RepID=A0ACB7SM73_HYAAI|nr:hypothetical protein HPB50_003980 [Hyalomma asiaticum]